MENQLLEQLQVAVKGIEEIKQSNELIKADLVSFKAEFQQSIETVKSDINELKVSLAKVDTKVEGIDKRLGNEEAISRIALGSVAGGTILAFIKYLFFS